MVDAQGSGVARGVACGTGEEGLQLLVVEDGPVAISGHRDLVGGFPVDGHAEVAADPRSKADPGVGSHGQLRPLQGVEGGVPPIEIGVCRCSRTCRPP